MNDIDRVDTLTCYCACQLASYFVTQQKELSKHPENNKLTTQRIKYIYIYIYIHTNSN